MDGIVDPAEKAKYLSRTYETCRSNMGGTPPVLHVVQLADVLNFKERLEWWTVLPLLRRTGAGVPIAVARDNIAEDRDPPQPVRSHLGVLDALQSDDIHVITAIVDGQSGELWPTIKGSAELTACRKAPVEEKDKKILHCCCTP